MKVRMEEFERGGARRFIMPLLGRTANRDGSSYVPKCFNTS